MLKFRSDGGFYFEAGPQVGFKISENPGDETIKDFFKNLDLSVGAGLGYHSPGGFGVGARYLAGLSKLGNFDPNVTDPSFKNSVIQIGISYTPGTPSKK